MGLSSGTHWRILASVLLIPIVHFLVKPLFQAITSPLRSVPGPFWARFTRLWELRQVWLGRFELDNIALHERYGPTVRLAPDRYSLSGEDPQCLNVIYGRGTKFEKSDFYDAFGPADGHNHLFSERDGTKHAADLRKVAGMYSMTSLVAYEPLIEKTNATLIRKLSTFARTGTPFDLMTWMQYYALDVIGEITFGHSFHTIESGRDNLSLLSAMDAANVKYGALVGIVPNLHPWLMLISSTLKLDNPVQPMIDTLTRELAEREKVGSERQDFLTKCLDLAKKGNIDEYDLRNTLVGNVGAGVDTTGASAAAIIYYLMQDEACMRRLVDEIDAAALRGPVTFQEALKLEYLQAVIKEGLRMHPVVGLVLSRVVPEGGATFSGTYFPAGSVVGVNPWVLHRNKKIWGEDANLFKPDRWLVSKEESNRLDASFLAFGAGSRSCIGKNISLLELNKLLPGLLRRFEFLSGQEGSRTTSSGWFVKMGYMVKVRERRI